MKIIGKRDGLPEGTKVREEEVEKPRFDETRNSEQVERCGRRKTTEDANDQD